MRRLLCLLLLLCGVGAADTHSVPLHPPITLQHLLRVQQECWGQAWISSGFYDWRTVSKYRRRAGLHLGYDIAMPYGAPVAAAWPGRVVAVTPWTSTEWGITVASPQGWCVTYGHLTPRVHVGQEVKSGTLLGAIASDHVDVKMRDAGGRYVPFGEKAPEVSTPDPQTLRRAWKQQRKLQKRLVFKVQTLQSRLHRSQGLRNLASAQSLQAQGLLSRRELAEQEDLHRSQARLQGVLQKAQLQLERETVKLKTLQQQLQDLGETLEPTQTAKTTEPSEAQLIRKLLERGDISQREWAESRIGDPLPSSGDEAGYRNLVKPTQ